MASRSGRRRENREDEEAVGAGVADAVGGFGGGDEEGAGGHGHRAAFEEEGAGAGQNQVDLVHSGVGVQAMLLAGFEGVQADEQALGLEERALAHSLRVVDGMVFGVDRNWMVEIHGSWAGAADQLQPPAPPPRLAARAAQAST
jgi:hypothetical protein